jgi:hypothetical protein
VTKWKSFITLTPACGLAAAARCAAGRSAGCTSGPSQERRSQESAQGLGSIAQTLLHL